MLPVLALAILLATALPAAADGGKVLLVNGRDTESATTLHTAIPVNATGTVHLVFRVAAWPGPDATAARAVVRMVLSDGVEAFPHEAPSAATFVQGQPGEFAIDVPLDGVANLGSGAFRVHAQLLDANGQVLFSSKFLVRLADTSFLTVEGVLVASLSLVLAYGVWHLVRDVLTLLGFIPNRKKDGKKEGMADQPGKAPDPRPAGFLQALHEAPSVLRIAGIALSLAVITVMWGHALGLVPLGQETLDALIGKAENALLLAGIGYAALVGAQAWRLRRRSAQEPAPSPKDS
ncbi:MAG: hypothetical protein ABR586_08525 [Thermoplasmatota archaeon]